MTDLAGIYPPIPTPFDQEGGIDFRALRENLEIWSSHPLGGVVMPGSNSEIAHLRHHEKVDLWRVCAEVLESSGKILIAGTGADTTRESIALTDKAADLGARAALIITPHFYTSQMTHEVLVAHFREIADQSPLEILLYNVPQFTGVDLAARTILELAKHPKIVGIKDSSANVARMSSVLANQPDFHVFSGSGSALLPFLSAGAIGGIMALANIAPRELAQIQKNVQNGEMKKAREGQLNLVDLNTAITRRHGIPGLKYAMDHLGLYGGPCRRPLLPMNNEGKLEIDDLIYQSGLSPLS